VFGVLARAARTQRGGALVEWWNAAAHAHGRLRPDGYGILLLGRDEYGFFLEFDRGTVRSAPLRAKFVAYHRYLASARAVREFDRPPSIVVLTAGPGAEDRVADAVMAAEGGQPRRLPVLLTTMDLLTTAGHGPFDCVWRIPGGHRGRCAWPSALGGM
jgi:Replication-relaxation